MNKLSIHHPSTVHVALSFKYLDMVGLISSQLLLVSIVWFE